MQQLPANRADKFCGDNLSDTVQHWAQHYPNQKALVHLADGENVSSELSYAQLAQRVEMLAEQLSHHAEPGERAVLCLDNEAEFLIALLACFRAGIIAIPSLTPGNERAIRRIEAHLLDSGATMVLLDNQAEKQLRIRRYEGDLTTALCLNVNNMPDTVIVKHASIQSPAYQYRHMLRTGIKQRRRMGEDRRSLPTATHHSMSDDGLRTPRTGCSTHPTSYRQVKRGFVKRHIVKKLDPQSLTDDDIAYLQYTSGSTMNPRGVMITHGNLKAQQQMLKEALDQAPQCVIVNWMPLHHDFGLVMSLQALYTGGCCVLLPPVRVVQQPIRWLRAIDRFHATLSAGATFMFDLCSRKVRPEQCLNLNLSHWRQVIIAAEPIHADIVQNFSAVFKDYGFRPSTFWPAYGMAEATLLITLKKGGEPVIRGFDTQGLQQLRVIASEGGQQLVGSGELCFPGSVRIIDPETQTQCPPDRIGELWVNNPCVGKGYWHQHEATKATFGACLAGSEEGPYLRTGDLAFIHQQEVFIAGRLKDTIIINGENRYPQDVEWTVNTCHPALEPGAGVAFGIEIDGAERLAIVYEIRRTARSELDVDEVVSAIRAAVAKQQELDVHTVVLLQPATLPKTSSGKVQRQTCKRRLLANDLATVAIWSAAAKKITTQASSPDSNELLMLCRTLLNDNALGMDDDLFAHGTDSLKSVELLTEIEMRWQCSIDPMDFIEQPTVSGLLKLITGVNDSENKFGSKAEALGAETKTPPSFYFGHLTDRQQHDLLAYTSAWQSEWVSPKRLLFGLNMHGKKPPLFWCCQGFQEFSQLARYLGADQPLYGMRSGHLVMDYTDKAAINALAGHYLEEILTVLPQHYYLLGGNCQAGLVATRMAQMLAGLGEHVRQLFILENIVPRVNASVLPFRIAMFYGRQSRDIYPYHQFPAPDSAWKKLYPMGYSVDLVNGDHGQFFNEPNIQDFANKLAMRLQESIAPRAFQILPGAAFSAAIEAQIQTEWLTGGAVMIPLRIKNTSPVSWFANEVSGLIAANHWLDENEQPLQWLDGYVPITETVLPGQVLTVWLPVTTPQNPGTYILEIDLAEQGMVWFKEKGNNPYRLTVTVPSSESEKK